MAHNIDELDHFDVDSEHLLRFCKRFDPKPDDTTESLLEVKLRDLEARWNRADASYENLLLSKDANLTSELRGKASKKFEECSDAYYNCTAEILELIKTFHVEGSMHPRGQSTSRYSGQNFLPQQTFTQNNPFDCIKLPPCDTEVFSGSYEQWPSFRDMFTALYISHSKLTPVTKLYHLRNKTRGEAGDIVKRYPLSNNNFDLAWEALMIRYENKRVLVDNQIKILFDIPAAMTEDSFSIRRIQSSVSDSLATLRSLDIQVESWDPILIRLISTKLPTVTLSLWEQSLKSPRELPKWSEMSQFLIDRYEAVERLSSIKNTKDSFKLIQVSQPNVHSYVSQENSNDVCKLCNIHHSLRMCPKFREFTTQQRIDHVFKNKFCNNCLSPSHLKATCTSKHTCLICRKLHHTLLHMPKRFKDAFSKQDNIRTQGQSGANRNLVAHNSSNVAQSKRNESNEERPCSSGQVQANYSMGKENILLRTALTQIEYRGEVFTVRTLIDPGSQRTFLSERVRSRLQLPFQKSHFEILGIGGQKQSANKECEFTLFAKRHNLRIPIKAIVLPKVTKHIPANSFKYPPSPELEKLDLADPAFYKSAQIDLILGNDYERSINLDGIKRDVCGHTSAYNTVFGWVLSGPIETQTIQTFTTSVLPSETSALSSLLRQFWEQEEIPSARIVSKEEEYCEKFYKETTTRLENGRYVVRLPFKPEFPENIYLGSSRFVALAQYSRMEKTLAKDLKLHSQYKAVLNEYLHLDHMEETQSHEIVVEGKYHSFYLPHHAVVRPEHKTTKLRVVFNASRKSKSQYSLNDVLYTGPTLQNDLITIILNWRRYQYVFSGDIQKMYRQILVNSEDRTYQRILFQDKPNEPIKDYQLKTVTFGVNCAPYLAIRTLLQLASESELKYPKAAGILRAETYVDDVLSGGYTIEETLSAQKQIKDVLKSAGFLLKKITSNNPQLLSHLPEEDIYDSEFLKFYESSTTKTLGISWNALNDEFSYSFSSIDQTLKVTKRQILSSIAKLFDPAGWLAPIVIRGKILMQQLWLEGLEWDEEVSYDSLQKWNNLVQDLSKIEQISIPRWIQYMPSDKIQVHGFSDASKAAYCATVFIRCETQSHCVFSNLLVAKSKVAPTKTVCLPRLELSGAVLLANLISYVISSLKFTNSELFLWTDSSIVLGWLAKPPLSWETYVANRIAQIHRLVPNISWRYVPSHDNPADLGTRGCRAEDIAHNSLWWNGPSWLSNPSSEWPKRNPLAKTEKYKEVQSFHVDVQNQQEKVTDFLERFSAYDKALHVTEKLQKIQLTKT